MEKDLKIEILFPEFCNLFADSQNIRYLKQCIPEATFIETAFNEEPKFVSEKVDFIYLGAMTERMQEKVISKLKKYKGRIEELINANTIFLFTGNSLEIMGEYIENEDGSKVEGLEVFNVHAKRDMLHRHNSFFIGDFEGIEIVGFKSQFSMMYGQNEENYFAKVEKGIGINKESKYEGIRKNNFFGTYLLGPILILNPEFTKELLRKMGIKQPKLAFEEEVTKAYEQRVKEFKEIKEEQI